MYLSRDNVQESVRIHYILSCIPYGESDRSSLPLTIIVVKALVFILYCVSKCVNFSYLLTKGN